MPSPPRESRRAPPRIARRPSRARGYLSGAARHSRRRRAGFGIPVFVRDLMIDNDASMGRIKQAIRVDGRECWTLFDAGAPNTYVTSAVAQVLTTSAMPRPI